MRGPPRRWVGATAGGHGWAGIARRSWTRRPSRILLSCYAHRAPPCVVAHRRAAVFERAGLPRAVSVVAAVGGAAHPPGCRVGRSGEDGGVKPVDVDDGLAAAAALRLVGVT